MRWPNESHLKALTAGSSKLLGLPAQTAMQGRSLLTGAPGAAYINSYGRCETAGVVEGTRKLIYDRGTRRGWATAPGRSWMSGTSSSTS